MRKLLLQTITIIKKSPEIQLFFLIQLIALAIILSKFAGSDPTLFKCYASAFWHTNLNLKDLLFCGHIFKDMYNLHSIIPIEYPFSSLAIFSLPLLFASQYQTFFILEMLFVILLIATFLFKTKSRQASYIFIFFIFILGLGLSLVRYDIVPAAFILFSLHFAIKKRFSLSYFFLALATLLKIFPILLLLSLFIYEIQSIKKDTNYFLYFKNLILYFLIGTSVTLISLLISFKGTLNPIIFQINRPFEIESIHSSILYILNLTHKFKVCSYYDYGSQNLYLIINNLCTTTSYSSLKIINLISGVFYILFIIGLIWIYLKTIKKQFSLEKSFISIILLFIITGKVFSPQYLIWVTPIIAYAYARDLSWIKKWTVVIGLTTLIYPVFWYSGNMLFLALIRNIFLIYIFLEYTLGINKNIIKKFKIR